MHISCSSCHPDSGFLWGKKTGRNKDVRFGSESSQSRSWIWLVSFKQLYFSPFIFGSQRSLCWEESGHQTEVGVLPEQQKQKSLIIRDFLDDCFLNEFRVQTADNAAESEPIYWRSRRRALCSNKSWEHERFAEWMKDISAAVLLSIWAFSSGLGSKQAWSAWSSSSETPHAAWIKGLSATRIFTEAKLEAALPAADSSPPEIIRAFSFYHSFWKVACFTFVWNRAEYFYLRFSTLCSLFINTSGLLSFCYKSNILNFQTTCIKPRLNSSGTGS